MLKVTEAALARILELIIDEPESEALHLRIYVEGGGCSGFQYGFAFTRHMEADDSLSLIPYNGRQIKILVDDLSSVYLQGASLDYVEDLNTASFIISNPNAKTTCGCGSSFSV